MNPSIVDRMYDESVSFGTKIRIPKRQFKRRESRVNYAKNMALFAQASETTGIKLKKFANLERRKQHKVRYDTWRRQEMPTEEDVCLENMHYSNFLGDKYGDNKSPYNTEYNVNLRFCDSMVENEDEQSADSFMRLARYVADRQPQGFVSVDFLLKNAESFEDDQSYANPYAYIAEYTEEDQSYADDISELSLGSNDDWLSFDDDYKQYCLPEEDVSDAISERIASAFKDIHERTMLYHQYYLERIVGGDANTFNFDFTDNDWDEDQSQKRGIEEAYKDEEIPESALKRARCDDESYNV
jgi:hypothetical protein